MTTFFGKKTKKKTDSNYNFTLKDIDVAQIDREFNMENMSIGNNLVFDLDEGTSLEKLGISSLKHEPMVTIVPKEKTKLQTFITMIDYLSKNKLQHKTDIPCFGCHRKFDSVPLGVPIDYHPSIYVSKNDSSKIKLLTTNEREKVNKEDVIDLEYYDVDGVVCSFNCIVSVTEDSPSSLYKKTLSLIPKMYKDIFGVYPKEKITRSPSWKLRREYGGVLSDEEFVRNLQTINYTDMNQVSRVVRKMNFVGRIFRVDDVNKN